MLGAILNPETFLPLASGAAVIIGYILYFYNIISNIEKTLDNIVEKVIEDQLQITIVNSLSNNRIISKITDAVEDLPQVTFNLSVNTFLAVNKFDPLERKITDEILNGNVEYLINVLDSHLGIGPEISKGIVGSFLDDPLMIADSVNLFAQKDEISAPYMVDIVDLLYFHNTNRNQSKKDTTKKTARIFKNIIKKIIPNFQVNLIDGLIKVLHGNDLTPLRKAFKSLKIPVETLDLLIASRNDKFIVQQSLSVLAKKILPDNFYNVFKALNKIATKNIFGSNDGLEKILKIEP